MFRAVVWEVVSWAAEASAGLMSAAPRDTVSPAEVRDARLLLASLGTAPQLGAAAGRLGAALAVAGPAVDPGELRAAVAAARAAVAAARAGRSGACAT